MTRAMNPRMRMSFESIRPGLASQPTLKVTLASPPLIHHCPRLPPIHHHHSRPRRRIQLVLPLSSRTRCLTSQKVSRPTVMRPRSITSSSSRMWRPSEMTCTWSQPTRRPSSTISSLSRTSSSRFSPSSNHHRRLHSDMADHQGSLYTLSFSLIDSGDNVLTCFRGRG